MREIELKLDVDPDDIAALRQYPLLARTQHHTVHQTTTYFDTPRMKLRDHGFTLRVRSARGKFIQTVKGRSDTVGLLSREEIEFEINSPKPDLALLEQHPLHELLGGGWDQKLRPVILCDVERTTWYIEEGSDQIELDLDCGTISAGGRCREFAELELELRAGQPAGLIVAARRIAEHVPVRLSVVTKAERGFLIADGTSGKATKAEPVHVQAGVDIAEAFGVIVHACIKHYRLNEPAVVHGRSPAALHQARVAIRRLRSALSLFRPAINDVEFRHMRREMRWLSRQLGEARNLDVYLKRKLDDHTRIEIIRRRNRAYDHVCEAMTSVRGRRLFLDLVGWTAVGAWRTGKRASRPVEGFASRRLDRRWNSLAKAGRDIDHLDDESRHRLRIEAKKLRYAVEFLRALYPGVHAAEKHFEKAIEKLQNALGKLNDIATADKLVEPSAAAHSTAIASREEKKQLIAAKHAMNELLNAGPFWS